MTGEPTKNLRFAVIGAGPGGKAMAAHLATRGYSVHLCNRSREPIERVRQRGAVRAHGALETVGRMTKVTPDIAQAIEDVEVIIVVVPAHAHVEIAQRCAPHLRAGQVVLLAPGRTFGAIEFRGILRRRGAAADVIVAESQTIPHTCRNINGENVNVLAEKQRVRLAAFPASRTAEVLDCIGEALPVFVPARDVLETGLNNFGAVLHPLPTLLNLGRIENKSTGFKHYYEGITPSLAAILEQLDRERIAVGHRLGTSMLSVRQWLGEVYGSTGDNLYQAIQNTECYRTIAAPDSLEHRYLLEDVPTGLVPFSSLGKAFGIDTPLIDVAIDLACAVCGADFKRAGRTLGNLGLDCMTVGELQAAVRGNVVSPGETEILVDV